MGEGFGIKTKKKQQEKTENLMTWEGFQKPFNFPKDLYKVKYQLLINKQGSKGLKDLNYFKTFIECSNGWYL